MVISETGRPVRGYTWHTSGSTLSSVHMRAAARHQFARVYVFEVARQDLQNGIRQRNKKREFFQAQEDDVQQAERDAADDASRVHGFDEHRSAVVPWLRETGIVDHVHGLNKDEIRTAIAVPPVGEQAISEFLSTLCNRSYEMLTGCVPTGPTVC